MDSTTNALAWNGPTCGICGVRWLGSHSCRNADILRRIGELAALLKPEPMEAPRQRGLAPDPTGSCSCRPENGGSGVCGCILGGLKVTC
jgi:hypothetical protein